VASEPRRELRPLDVADIFDGAFRIWWRQSWILFGIVLVVTVPFQALANLVQVLVIPDAYEEGFAFGFDGGPEFGPDAILATAAAGILLLISYAFEQAGCVRAVADAYVGRKPAWRKSLAFALRRGPSVFWLVVLESLLLMLAFLLLVAPAVWLGFAWSVAIPALVVEEIRGRRALGRSFRLVRGRWWRTAGVVLLGFILASFAGLVVTLPFNAIAIASAPDNLPVAFLAGTLAGTVGAVVSTPLLAAFTTLVYFDLRARGARREIELATS
jgi:hypothetical protein